MADYFLEIDGIKGEATDATHKDKIQVESWSWGETQAGSAGNNSGMGASRVSMQDFNFVMATNKASPELMQACATGKHIAKGQLICRKAGGKQEEFLKISFDELIISSYQTGGNAGGGDLPMDQISFNFSKIKFECAQQKKEGGLGSPVIKGYNLKEQKAF